MSFPLTLVIVLLCISPFPIDCINDNTDIFLCINACVDMFPCINLLWMFPCINLLLMFPCINLLWIFPCISRFAYVSVYKYVCSYVPMYQCVANMFLYNDEKLARIFPRVYLQLCFHKLFHVTNAFTLPLKC